MSVLARLSQFSPDNRPSRWIKLGDAIRAVRKAHRLSQEEAADRAGVSRGTWIDWEGSARSKRDGRIPDERVFIDAITKFCLDIGIDPRQLLSQESTYTSESTSPFRKGFSVTAAVRQWRGALAADHGDDDYFEPVEPFEIPTAFLVGGMDHIGRHDVIQVNGTSLEPRVHSGERIVIYNDQTRFNNTIVMAESPDGKVYVKVLRTIANRFVLQSIREGAATFDDLTDWQIHGYAVAIIGDPANGSRNIEWLFSQPLKA